MYNQMRIALLFFYITLSGTVKFIVNSSANNAEVKYIYYNTVCVVVSFCTYEYNVRKENTC